MASKEVMSQEDISKIKEALTDSKGVSRRNAAKKIGKKKIVELSDDLFNAYEKEIKDIRNWETLSEMIIAMGKIGCDKIIPTLEEIIKENKQYDRITSAAALAYVRLKRKTPNDVIPIISLIHDGKLSVMNGATSALTYDDMIPSDEDIKTLIDIFNRKEEKELVHLGSSDPRSYLISAMSQWKKEFTSDYLKQYIDTPRLKEYALASLKGKKSRYE